jgi:hypothetical protein
MPAFTVLYMMVVRAFPADTFSLMARCLAGESSAEDAVRLADLLSSHPSLKEEYKYFQRLFNTHFRSREDSLEEDPQPALDRVRRKLKEEGLI